MLLAINIVKLIAEIAGLALLGQFIIGLLAGAGREQNPFYKVLAIVGKPFVVGARWLAPKVVLDRHLPLVAFLLALMLWVAAVLFKAEHCLKIGMALCK